MRNHLKANHTDFANEMFKKSFQRPSPITTSLFLDEISKDVIAMELDQLEEVKDTSAINSVVRIFEVMTEVEFNHHIKNTPKSSIQKLGEAAFLQLGTSRVS